MNTAADLLLFQSDTHPCVQCRQPFEARAPFVRFCDACTEAILADEQAAQTRPTWNDTFPERARDESQHTSGRAAQTARQLLPVIAAGGIVVLCGDRGTGKTVMATWIAGQLRAGLYTKAYDLFAAIKATWDQGSRLSEQQALERWRKPRFLIIDEAQERSESDWENRTLTNLIDHRYDARKATLIITNQSREQTAHTLGPSIIRRANQTGGVFACDWACFAFKHLNC